MPIGGNVLDNDGTESLTLTGDGSGQLVLSGSDGYGGATNVLAGTLTVQNSDAWSSGRS